jgi:RHS repeat-associated protein
LTGRWIAKDPNLLGGGHNLVTYADDEPVNHKDANGFIAAECDKCLDKATS